MKKTRKSESRQRDELKHRLEELEEMLRYNEAMLEEIYETQESLFPIFADIVRLVSRLYQEMKIDDDELKGCINRLKETFIDDEENLLKKYALKRDDDDFSIAYT